MYATAKTMFFPFFADEAKEVSVKKPVAQAAVKTEAAPQQNERMALIDNMVATWGTDINMVRRYFELSRAA